MIDHRGLLTDKRNPTKQTKRTHTIEKFRPIEGESDHKRETGNRVHNKWEPWPHESNEV